MNIFKKKEEKYNKTFFVSATYTKHSHYNKVLKKNGEQQEYHYYDKNQSFSRTARARNEKDAQQKVKQQLEEYVANEGGTYEQLITAAEHVDFITTTPTTSVSTSNMPMRAAKYVTYDFIPEDTKHFKHDGFCVIDVLLGVYANLPRNKKLTREWIIQRCGDKDNNIYADDYELENLRNIMPEYVEIMSAI